MNRTAFASLLMAMAIGTTAMAANKQDNTLKGDTLNMRTTLMGEVQVVSTPKENGSLRQQPTASSQVSAQQMDNQHITSLKGVSSMVPNFFLPDYGSRLTSAVYIRGVGSRINTPAVGMYVDNIPFVDKSAFDFNFYDIERVDVLRGPQATLYGRNSMAGLVKVHTRNPLLYQGTHLKMGYATGDNHRSISLTHYHKANDQLGFSASGYYESGDGFFENDVTGKNVDAMKAGGARLRGVYVPNERWKLDAQVSFDQSNEGAYPYYYTGTLNGEEPYAELVDKISNNHHNRYRRSMLNGGANLEYKAPKWQMNAVTGYQWLRDRMFMDQDFLQPDIYTLEQKQRIHTISEEVTFKNRGNNKWERLTGVNLMYQALHTEGPVTFMPEGVEWLNQTIQGYLPVVEMTMGQTSMQMPMTVDLTDEQIRMGGTFETPFLNLALFHQSTYHFNEHLSATFGLRLDYEHNSLTYNAPAKMNYNFTMTSAMMPINLTDMVAKYTFDGKLKHGYFNVQPKFSVMYDFDGRNNIYATVSKGVRSGGYNVQLFSDLLQSALQNEMMQGVKTGSIAKIEEIAASNPRMPQTVVSMIKNTLEEKIPAMADPNVDAATTYKPESTWNYEVGTHLSTQDQKLTADASVFYMRTQNQQIARFAQSGLGRQMVNAGTSESAGAELTLRYQPNWHWALQGNYGYTFAHFVDYNDGKVDYRHNRVPFVPEHTVGLDASYRIRLNSRWAQVLSFGANYQGAGKIYWTEDNSVRQSFYSLLGARIALDIKHIQVMLWGKNLTSTDYNTFYFESAGRGFEQHGKPLQVGLDLRVKF